VRWLARRGFPQRCDFDHGSDRLLSLVAVHSGVQNRPNIPHAQNPRGSGAGSSGGAGSGSSGYNNGNNGGWLPPLDGNYDGYPPNPDDPTGRERGRESGRGSGRESGSGRPPQHPQQFSPGQRPDQSPGQPAGPPTSRPPKRRKRRARRIFTTIAVLLVVAMVATGGYAVYSYNRFVSGVTHIDAIATSTFADIDGDDQNILLVGDDHRPADATAEELAQMGTELDGGSTSTDTMMVLHLPADGSAATLISLPRDSWVDIEGYGNNKLNAAFTFGTSDGDESTGAQLLTDTVQNITGLRIDHFVRVSMLGFYNLVDALGPVNVCLNNAVDDPYSTLSLPAGVSTLNAQQALAFVRQRHGLPNGDLDRQVRQQYFLSVEARAILSPTTLLNPGKFSNVLDAASGAIQTDPDLNFLNLGMSLVKVGADNLSSAIVPISGTPTIWSGGSQVSIVELDTALMPSFIAGIVGTSEAYTNATASSVGDVAVTVLNGSGVSGAAGDTTDLLAGLGFQTSTPDSTDDRTVSTIEYPPGMEAQAKAVAAALPAATVTPSAFVDSITVVIGANGLEAPAVEGPVDVPAADVPAADVPAAESGTDTGAVTNEETGTTSYAAGACIN
jgi:LCP family protein required for cell wall assembly